MNERSDVTIIDGTLDFSSGVNSYLVTTIRSELNPNGLPRNALAWLANGTIRGGGIRPRSGWQPLGTVIEFPGLYQGGFLYEPVNANPYLVFLMSGHLYAAQDINTPGSIIDLSAAFGLFLPATEPQAFFVQAEEYLIVQAGDYITNPLFWDGTTLTQSVGVLGPTHIPGGVLPLNELPPAGPMCYYMGRVWYAQGRLITAGDIVGSQASGTGPTFRDSVLKVTENPLAIGGDGFIVPSQAGNIRAIDFSANLNSLLGQGTLYIFTRKDIYSLQVPVTRTDWIGANSANQPLMYAVGIGTGSVNDRSVAAVNGDLFFQTLQPSIQSLQASVRNFSQWGNVPVSVNEDRILAFNDRSLLWASSGIYFDNRLIETALPKQTENGVVHQSLVPLNFDNISTLNSQLPPAWEGQLAGLGILQLFVGDFGGLDRALALTISDMDHSLQLWELTQASHTDNGDSRIPWAVEFPAFTWGREFALKELMTMELWLDDIRGTVDITVDYRPDSDACFYPWHRFRICAARDSNELLNPTTPYPTKYGPGYRSTVTLPHPPQKCAAFTGRPAYIGYQFQPRLQLHGWCRIRGIFLHAATRDRELYAGKVCESGAGVLATTTNQPVNPFKPKPPKPPTPTQKGIIFGNPDADIGFGNPDADIGFGNPDAP